MTLKEFLDAIYIPDDDNVAIFRERSWEGAPEFGCTIAELKTKAYADLMDKEVRGIASGGELARCELPYAALDCGENIFEIALDWDGDEF